MLVLCYHNGALGHAARALLDCCSQEGNEPFPSFEPGQNLHHFQPSDSLVTVQHPICHVHAERQQGNFVIASTSESDFGRFLILAMGLNKWNQQIPDYNDSVVYKQYGTNYGDQLEILSLTLKEKVYQAHDWFVDADSVLEILDYWHSPHRLSQNIRDCGLSPIPSKVLEFAQKVSESNQCYFDYVRTCFDTVAKVLAKEESQECVLDFFQTAICHAKLLHDLDISHKTVKLFDGPPSRINTFTRCFLND